MKFHDFVQIQLRDVDNFEINVDNYFLSQPNTPQQKALPPNFEVNISITIDKDSEIINTSFIKHCKNSYKNKNNNNLTLT